MPQGHNVPNPMPNGTRRVEADIDSDVFNFFFKGLYIGERGPRQAFICTFFKRFHEACINEGIKPEWDTNEPARASAILDRLNFNVAPVPAPSEPGPGYIRSGQRSSKPTRARRPVNPPPIPPTQPNAQEHVRGPTS